MVDGSYNVNPLDDRVHRDAVSEDEELWENHGWLFRGADDDHEFMLWDALYLIKGAPDGQFAVDEVCFPQTIFIHGEYPPDERDQMHDNDFTVAGTHFHEYSSLEAMVTEESEEEVRWCIGDREHVSRPPEWHNTGEQAGVDIDLSYEAAGPAFWAGEDLEQINGFEQSATGSGTITVDGEIYHPEGYGQHEKFYFVDPDMLEDSFGRGDWIGGEWWRWHTGFQEDIQVFLTIEPNSESAIGRVLVEGDVYNFGYDDVTFHDVRYWDDPRSGITIPVEWHVNMRSAEAVVDFTASAYARAYYVWDYMTTGYNVLYWQMADAEGLFVPRDGPERDLDMTYMGHTKRPWLRFGKNNRTKQ